MSRRLGSYWDYLLNDSDNKELREFISSTFPRNESDTKLSHMNIGELVSVNNMVNCAPCGRIIDATREAQPLIEARNAAVAEIKQEALDFMSEYADIKNRSNDVKSSITALSIKLANQEAARTVARTLAQTDKKIKLQPYTRRIADTRRQLKVKEAEQKQLLRERDTIAADLIYQYNTRYESQLQNLDDGIRTVFNRNELDYKPDDKRLIMTTRFLPLKEKSWKYNPPQVGPTNNSYIVYASYDANGNRIDQRDAYNNIAYPADFKGQELSYEIEFPRSNVSLANKYFYAIPTTVSDTFMLSTLGEDPIRTAARIAIDLRRPMFYSEEEYADSAYNKGVAVSVEYDIVEPSNSINVPLYEFHYSIEGLEDNNMKYCVYSALERFGYGAEAKAAGLDTPSGITPAELYVFAKSAKINMVMLGPAYKKLFSVTAVSKTKTLYFMAMLGHLYITDDANYKARLTSMSRKFISSDDKEISVSANQPEHKITATYPLDWSKASGKSLCLRVTNDQKMEILRKFIRDKQIPIMNGSMTSLRYGKYNITMLSAVDNYDSVKALRECSIEYKSFLSDPLRRIFDMVPTGFCLHFTDTKEKIKCIDVCKQYSYILGNFEHPKYSATARAEPYTDHKRVGFYYIEKSFIYLGIEFGWGWYCREYIQWFISKSLIRARDILFQLIANETVDFSGFVKHVYKNYPNPKFLVNRTIGSFRKTSYEIYTPPTFVHRNEVNEYQYSKEIIDGVYLVQNSKRVIVQNTACPIYCNVIQLAALQTLMKMDSMREAKIIGCRIDSIYYVSDKTYDTGTSIGDWRACDSLYKPCNKRYRAQIDYYDITLVGEAVGDRCALVRCIREVTDVKEFIGKYDILSRKCVSIEGMAGTGKSYLMNSIVKYLLSIGEKPHCVAFQNNAASQMIGGRTVHKKFYINYKDRRLTQRIKTSGWIILDEYQQVPMHLIDIIYSQVSYGKAKLICFGDEKQFIAINNDGFGCEINHTTSLPFDLRIRLTKNKRIADEEYIGWITAEEWDKCITKCTATNIEYVICYYNSDVDRYNKENPSNKLLCIESHGDFVKGMHYLEVDDKVVVDGNFHSEVATYDKPKRDIFVPGYAFTCHKTIGLTIKAPYGIYCRFPPAERNRFMLVALTRCIDPCQIKIL